MKKHLKLSNDRRRSDAYARNREIILAVSSGRMTYAKAGAEYGRSRAAVAGIMHRARKNRLEWRSPRR